MTYMRLRSYIRTHILVHSHVDNPNKAIDFLLNA